MLLRCGLRPSLRITATTQPQTNSHKSWLKERGHAKEKAKDKILNEVKHAVASYQGQATLGKIVNVLLHEGRKPLGAIDSQVPLIKYWLDELSEGYSEDAHNEMISAVGEVKENAGVITRLFKRIDPLAASRKQKPTMIDIRNVIMTCFGVFDSSMRENNISFSVNECDFKVLCWKEDVYSIFTNLIENSIYWVDGGKGGEISVDIVQEDGRVSHIDYRDSGRGIDLHLLKDDLIFEPEFSTKTGGVGSGLGLAIAGEAAERNGWDLVAFESDQGAYFRVENIKSDEENE